MDIERLRQPIRQSAFWNPTTVLYLEALLAFILIRLVLYAHEEGNFDRFERESSAWFITKFSLIFAFLLCLALQALL
jgi:hypothetical protein